MTSTDVVGELAEDFYSRIKPRLQQRIGKELRLAGRVVDLGCGGCDLSRYLAQTYGQQVTGVDLSAAGFPRRRRTPSGARFRCLVRDGRQLDFTGADSIDAVVTLWAFHEISQPQAVLGEIRRILRPGGQFLVVDFPQGSLAQRLWDEAYYSLEEIMALLAGAGLEEVRGRLTARGQIAWVRGWKPALVR